ncbi:hypothetical protein LIA77_04761 [Sarocladium implicatum]|nr:hypothetical protein LIA77_04761 [Sarocladium implicatum]
MLGLDRVRSRWLASSKAIKPSWNAASVVLITSIVRTYNGTGAASPKLDPAQAVELFMCYNYVQPLPHAFVDPDAVMSKLGPNREVRQSASSGLGDLMDKGGRGRLAWLALVGTTLINQRPATAIPSGASPGCSAPFPSLRASGCGDGCSRRPSSR